MVVSAWRVKMGDRLGVHLVLFVLLSAAWAISLVQVRGATFPQMLSILPLSVLIAELHAISRRDPDSVVAGLPFAIMTLASIPSFWFVAGFVVAEASGSEKATKAAEAGNKVSACVKEASLDTLNRLPKGMIAAPSNMGAPILRFTGIACCQRRIIAIRRACSLFCMPVWQRRKRRKPSWAMWERIMSSSVRVTAR